MRIFDLNETNTHKNNSPAHFTNIVPTKHKSIIYYLGNLFLIFIIIHTCLVLGQQKSYTTWVINQPLQNCLPCWICVELFRSMSTRDKPREALPGGGQEVLFVVLALGKYE